MNWMEQLGGEAAQDEMESLILKIMSALVPAEGEMYYVEDADEVVLRYTGRSWEAAYTGMNGKCHRYVEGVTPINALANLLKVMEKDMKAKRLSEDR